MEGDGVILESSSIDKDEVETFFVETTLPSGTVCVGRCLGAIHKSRSICSSGVRFR